MTQCITSNSALLSIFYYLCACLLSGTAFYCAAICSFTFRGVPWWFCYNIFIIIIILNLQANYYPRIRLWLIPCGKKIEKITHLRSNYTSDYLKLHYEAHQLPQIHQKGFIASRHATQALNGPHVSSCFPRLF